MTQIIPFFDQVKTIDSLEEKINELGEDSPEKAYLIGIALSKLGDKAKKTFSDGFKNFYDTQKELPGGFECKIVNGSQKYNFEDDMIWSQIKATLDARESLLKSATDLKNKGGTFTDPNTGEIIEGVGTSWTATSYRVTRK